MRIFLDACILFSAARSGSLVSRFLVLLQENTTLVTNHYAVQEARRNIQIKLPEHLLELDRLTAELEMVHSTTYFPEIAIREKDRPILEGAISAHCSHLLTSDKRDFGPFFGKKIQGVKVVSPEQLAKELVKKGILKRA